MSAKKKKDYKDGIDHDLSCLSFGGHHYSNALVLSGRCNILAYFGSIWRDFGRAHSICHCIPFPVALSSFAVDYTSIVRRRKFVQPTKWRCLTSCRLQLCFLLWYRVAAAFHFVFLNFISCLSMCTRVWSQRYTISIFLPFFFLNEYQAEMKVCLNL